MTAVILATVASVRQVSDSFVRVTFSGCGGLESGGYDQRIKILLARPGQDRPVLPGGATWYQDYCALPEDVRPIMRTFTIRSQDGDLMDIEFALHGDAGPASAWAKAARPGHTLGIIGPEATDEVKALQYTPGDVSWQLLVGDDTAVPALTAILETLPAGAVAKAFLQVPTAADVRELPGPAEVTWLVGGGLGEAVRAASLPAGPAYAWVAGESAVVRDIRRYLVGELGWNAKEHYFGGYWKAGAAEN